MGRRFPIPRALGAIGLGVVASALSLLAGAQDQAPCPTPPEPTAGHLWIFVRANMALRSLRYAPAPEPLKRPGVDAGEAEVADVAIGACVALQLPNTAPTLYFKARGSNVDRALSLVQTVSACRDGAVPCALPLVPVSARQQVRVEATGTLSSARLAEHGVDATALGAGSGMRRGAEVDATWSLTVIPESDSRDIIGLMGSDEPEATIEFWTPPRADYVVVPAAELGVELPVDWAVLRGQLTWFRTGEWLLGSESDDAIDSTIALRCTSDSCAAREIHGDAGGVLVVDREVARLGPVPADLDTRTASIAVSERPVTESPLILRRGTAQIRGSRTVRVQDLGGRTVRRELPDAGVDRRPGDGAGPDLGQRWRYRGADAGLLGPP